MWGRGGLDATNAISHSEYAIFTKIGMDHLNLLGDSLQAIVATKAGIIRSGQQVIVAPNQKVGVVDRLKQISWEQKVLSVTALTKRLFTSVHIITRWN